MYLLDYCQSSIRMQSQWEQIALFTAASQDLELNLEIHVSPAFWKYLIPMKPFISQTGIKQRASPAFWKFLLCRFALTKELH